MKVVQFSNKFILDVCFFFRSNKIFFKIYDKIYIVLLPFVFFIKKIKDGISFLLTCNYLYKTMLLNILNIFFKYGVVYFFRLKLRGLGFKIRKYKNDLFRFFFGLKHFFYLYVPLGLIFKKKGKKFIVLSDNLVKLNNFFSQIMFLKKMDFYEKNNAFFSKNKILYIKKRK